MVGGLPPPVKDLEDMKTESFPESLLKTVDGENWLVYNERKIESMSPRIFIFVSDHVKKMLEESRIWLVDGTFKVRFSQCLI